MNKISSSFSQNPKLELSFLKNKCSQRSGQKIRPTREIQIQRENNRTLSKKKVKLMGEYVEEMKAFRIKFMNECRCSNFYLKKMVLLGQENNDPFESDKDLRTTPPCKSLVRDFESR